MDLLLMDGHGTFISNELFTAAQDRRIKQQKDPVKSKTGINIQTLVIQDFLCVLLAVVEL